MTRIARLPDRAVLAVAGADRVGFLQGLVSNDVAQAVPGRAVWAALLTPQGKYLTDFFILATPDRLLLDVAGADAPDLLRRLARYRLRAAVTLAELPDWAVYAAWDGAPAVPSDSVAAPDPRLPDAGWRILSPVVSPAVSPGPLPVTAEATDWDGHRLSLGLPDGARDLEREKTVLLEAGFDELNGVSWTKGCYMGQELTARTHYRGLLKRRLVPVAIEDPAPAPDTPIHRADAPDTPPVGTLRSARDGIGLALLRLDALAVPLTAGTARLTPRIPPWMRLPETET